jgi:hypothetical protein
VSQSAVRGFAANPTFPGEIDVTKTLREIADATQHAVLLKLLEQHSSRGDMPISVSSEAHHEEQVKAAFRVLVESAFDDEELDADATLARIREMLESHTHRVGPMAADDGGDAGDGLSEAGRGVPPDVHAELRELREELAQLRRRETARQVLEAEGLDSRDISPERLRLLHAQPDEAAMRSLVESWPPYVRQPQRRAFDLREPLVADRYPQSLDEFVAAVR